MASLFGLPDGESNNWFGQLFIMFCYGFILYKAAVLIGDGSEKLLLIYGPGIVGGLLIPILGAVPDGAIVLVSGLGSASEAQCQVSVGVGTLAGSTIMLLTIPWSISLYLGRRDQNAIGEAASDERGRPLYTKFNWTKSCVTTYKGTVFAAKIMILTGVSYLIVLIPAIVNKSKSAAEQIASEHYPALAGLIVCAIAFVAYSIFQLYDSNAQTTQQLEQTRLEFVRWKQTVGRKVAGSQNAAKVVFQKFDKDKNGTIDREELKKGFKMLGLELDRGQVMKLMEEYNLDDDKDTLTEEEFTSAMKKWSRTVLSTKAVTRLSHKRSSQINLAIGGGDNIEMKHDSEKEKLKTSQPTIINVDAGNDVEEEDDNNKDSKSPLKKDKKKGYDSLHNEDDDDDEFAADYDTSNESGTVLVDKMLKELQMQNEIEEEEGDEEEEFLEWTDDFLILVACVQLIFGTFLCCIFSDPMVATIGYFSDTIGVSSFYVSFIITPIASNASEIYSSLLFASKKSTVGISMGFSALYGAACMNNTFVLCIFCALIFFRELEWTFIAETLVILLTVIVVGINGMRKTVIVWQGVPVILLFPLALLLVAVLDTYLDDTTSC